MYVFKSSKEKAHILELLDRRSENGCLSKELVYFDGNHNRVKGFITLGQHVFHPFLGRMVTLATIF